MVGIQVKLGISSTGCSPHVDFDCFRENERFDPYSCPLLPDAIYYFSVNFLIMSLRVNQILDVAGINTSCPTLFQRRPRKAIFRRFHSSSFTTNRFTPKILYAQLNRHYVGNKIFFHRIFKALNER